MPLTSRQATEGQAIATAALTPMQRKLPMQHTVQTMTRSSSIQGWGKELIREDEGNMPAGLLDSLYDAVIAPDGFQQFIVRLTSTFELKGVGLLVRHLDQRDSMGLWLHGIESSWMESYATIYGSEDMLALHLEHAPIGKFYSSNLDLPSPERFGETRFFREWAQPQGVAYAAGSVVMREGPWLTQVFLQRSTEHPPFSRDEMAQMNQLVPHLQRATQMRQRLGSLRAGRHLLAASLNAFAIPIVLFDEHGCIAHENNNAADLLDKGDAIYRVDRRVMASTKTASRAFHAALGDAVRSQRTPGMSPASVVLVERAGRRPLSLMMVPLHGSGEDGSHSGALLFVFDPEATPSVTAELLQRLFGFTAAESELAVALCAGSSPEEIAFDRDRSISTVRNQIRSLYTKTGAHRQSDLIGLMLASPAYFLAKEHVRSPE